MVTAESCTGGLIAAALARAEGASEVLHGGFVVYTKEQKAKALGVSRTLLAREGAVNGTVARQLADGARRRSSATLALAITGVLGPAPDDDGNPVGLIFFAISRRGGKTLAFKRRFPRQSHDRLRTAAMHEAFALLCAYAPKKR